MSDITINLNNGARFTTKSDIIELIDVLNSQLDFGDSGEELSILNDDIEGNDLNLILCSLTLYLREGSKKTTLPQPMPDNKTFDEIVQEVWEKHILEDINEREEEDERIKYALKMATISDYLSCIMLKNFFCAYIGSWMRRTDNDQVSDFFKRSGMIAEE